MTGGEEGGAAASSDSVQSGTGGVWEGLSRGEKLLGSMSSIFSFTRAFKDIANMLAEEGEADVVAQSLITIDGGPHTLWW